MSGSQVPSYGEQPFGANGLTATGTKQRDALMLPTQINVFTSVPVGSGCRSPAVPSTLTVINNGANTLLWYPPSGDKIYGNAVNAAISVPAGQQITMAWFGSSLEPAPRVWQLINNGFGLNLSVPGTMTAGSALVSGALTLTGNPAIQFSATITQPTGEANPNQFITNAVMTADNTQDVLGVVSRFFPAANGHHITAQHGTAFYAVGTAFDTVAGGTTDWVNGYLAQSGNQGLGTVTTAVDFRGHSDINNAGGNLTNHWFGYQETSSAATNEYGLYLTGALSFGGPSPTYNIDMGASFSGTNFSTTNWMRIGSGTGQLLVGSGGASLVPGFNPGAGGMGVLDMIVGNNGAAETTSSTGAFLYISSCAGTPTGVPARAAVGRIALRYDTTADKIWFYNGSAWKGIAVT